MSNHEDLRGVVEREGIEFRHVPVSPETKTSADQELIALIDEGPITTQHVTPVNHSDTPASMVIAGRDIERLVLSRAVRAHVEECVFLIGRRTIVFS